MSKEKGNTISTYIKTIYAEGFSFLRIWYYNTYLSFCFAPYNGKKNGLSQYDKTKNIMTTINYEGAALFYLLAKLIIDGNDADKAIKAVLPGYNNNTNLTFEYKPDEKSAYLVISKNNESIPFKFSTYPVKFKENGQMFERVIQTGLGTFACTLEGYLTGINADGHLNKLLELGDFDKYQDEDQQMVYTYDSTKKIMANDTW